jgi:hypothetical protein
MPSIPKLSQLNTGAKEVWHWLDCIGVVFVRAISLNFEAFSAVNVLIKSVSSISELERPDRPALAGAVGIARSDLRLFKAWARTDGEHGFSTSFGLIEYPGTTKTHAAAACRKYRCGCERCDFHFCFSSLLGALLIPIYAKVVFGYTSLIGFIEFAL